MAARTSTRSATGRDPGGPTVLWQARVPRELAHDLEDDMRVLGLEGQSDTIRAALRLLHVRAREVSVGREYEEFYAGERAPLPSVVAALYGDDGDAGVYEVGGGAEASGGAEVSGDRADPAAR